MDQPFGVDLGERELAPRSLDPLGLPLAEEALDLARGLVGVRLAGHEQADRDRAVGHFVAQAVASQVVYAANAAAGQLFDDRGFEPLTGGNQDMAALVIERALEERTLGQSVYGDSAHGVSAPVRWLATMRSRDPCR
ncbi:MAG: hypothetical protein ACYS22_03955 [Planctomycetota bacterium]